MFNIAAIVEAIAALALVAGLIISTAAMIRAEFRAAADRRARAAVLTSPAYLAAVDASRVAWAAVCASRTAAGFATVAAMDTYRAAVRNRETIAARF